MRQLLLFIVYLFCISGVSAQSQSNQESLDPSEYGQNRSIGISLLGDGLAGVVLRFVSPNQNQFEISPSFASSFVTDIDDNIELEALGINVGGAYNIYLGTKEKSHKNKIIKNYIGLRGNIGFVGDPIVGGHLVWHREAFYKGDHNYSRGLDLGIGITEIIDSNVDVVNSGFNVFIKFDWNWFRS